MRTARRCCVLIVLAHLLSLAPLATAAPVDGFTEPIRRIDVAPAETGTITTLAVHEGDRVAKGQQLATLDNEVLEVSLAIAQAGREARGKIHQAVADYELRRNRLEKLQQLREHGHASGEEVERARSELAIAEANLMSTNEQHRQDELEYRKIQAMIERRTLRSPINGLVLKIHKDEHEFVSPNNATVFTVVQLDTLRVVFGVPTALAAGLRTGQTLAVIFPDTGARADGKIEFIAPLTDAESGTVRVKVLLENAQGKLACGVRCKLNLDTQTAEVNTAPLTVGSAQ